MEEEKTFLTLKILDFQENLLINKIKLDVYNKFVYIRKKEIEIEIKHIPENVNDFYVEKIGLFLNNKPNEYSQYFRIRIHKNQNNIYGIFLNKLNNYSFEIIYFNKINDIPSSINIEIDKTTYTIEESCKTDLPFIKKFAIINCDKSIIVNKKEEVIIEEEKKGSFEIDYFYIGKNYNIKTKKIHKENYPKLIINEEIAKSLKIIISKVKEKIFISEKLKKPEFSLFLNDILEISTIKPFFFEYTYFISNKIYPLKDEQYLFLLNYIIYQIIKKVNCHTESLAILKTFFLLLFELEEKMKKKLITNRDILSICTWFCINYTSVEKYKFCLNKKKDNYIEIYETNSNKWLDFEILYIKECNDECSYYKAFKLINEVVGNLKTNSLLLEILYFMDSGFGTLRNGKKNKSFNLSKLSKDDIISHVKNIIPNFIIRKEDKNSYYKSSKGYAEYDVVSGLLIFYEKELLGKSLPETRKILVEEKDSDDKYSLPIYLLLLREICSHSKLLQKKNKDVSPDLINYTHNKYNEIMLRVGEGGRIMEFYINNDIKKIKFLKFSFTPKKELLDKELWIGQNFDELNRKIEELMIRENDDYLQYDIFYFPGETDNLIIPYKNDNKEKKEGYIDSSAEFTEEEFYDEESDIKNKYKKEEEFHINFFEINPKNKICF